MQTELEAVKEREDELMAEVSYLISKFSYRIPLRLPTSNVLTPSVYLSLLLVPHILCAYNAHCNALFLVLIQYCAPSSKETVYLTAIHISIGHHSTLGMFINHFK